MTKLRMKSQEDSHTMQWKDVAGRWKGAIKDVFSGSSSDSESWEEPPDDREKQKKVEADAATQQVCTTAAKRISIFQTSFSHLTTIVGV